MPFKINMDKARGIHMDRIREVRNAELAKKDIEYMKGSLGRIETLVTRRKDK